MDTIFSFLLKELGVSSAAVARICLEQDLCSLLSPVASGITYSANFGVASVFGFVSCCDNDLCNNKSIPEVDNTPNGLICPTCNSVEDPTCNSTVFCVGNQDRCANGTPKEIITGTSKVLLNKADVFEAIQETNTQQPGFPPDILHDLLEGVIPVELALCLKELGVSSAAVARICLEQDLCSLLSPVASGITYSANFGVASVFGFVSCCDNDLCNNKSIPEVDNTPNGLICPTCNSVEDPTCNSTVFCVGNQDRCANGTLPNMQIFGPAVNMPVMGSKEIITGTSKVLLNKADVFEAIQETNTQQPGFPPDILHDLLEGVIPVELALCLKGLLNAIEMATQLKLRVILDDENAEKLILPSRPETVNDLIFEVKNKLELTYDIRLQFQDPDFDNALCNLVNMEDLPSKATIKIVRLVEYDLSSTSTDETVMLSDNTDSPDRLSRWPEVFVVPTFSYEVEYTLKEGNCTFEKEGKSLILTRDQKQYSRGDGC
ncbi:hypothetical protein SRHO_G00296680 [Serrasalmus rhombeus]